MNDFRNQINEDILEYQTKFPNIQNIDKPEWAFNFWILDNFFQMEEELIEYNIVDYKDLGIDCFTYFEDTKELFLIQNKYYSDATTLSRSYVEDDFLIRPINALKEGTYRKNNDLQKQFNKMKNDPEFSVYLQIYVTNNNSNPQVQVYQNPVGASSNVPSGETNLLKRFSQNSAVNASATPVVQNTSQIMPVHNLSDVQPIRPKEEVAILI